MTRPAVVAFVLTFAVRAWMILALPFNFSFDGFQRWAGRDHLLIQAWLPLTQSIIVAVTTLGADLTVTRLAMALVAAGASAAGVLLAGQMGGRPAAWAFLAPACFGPFLVWGTALYQEGTFLLVLFSALALALSGRLVAADVVMGLLALVRYEGWPCVALYVLWRRDARALVALWGVGVWLAVKASGVVGYASSPIDFDDWEGLTERASWARWWKGATKLFRMAWDGGAIAYTVASFIVLVAAWKRRGVVLVTLIGLGQVAAVSGWMVGLETATTRMLVVPAMIAGVLAAVAVGVLWERLPTIGRALVCAGGAALVVIGVTDAWGSLRSEQKRMRHELGLLAELHAHPDCAWHVTPRPKLGTRSRHDGCEVLQGQGFPRHGDGFWCTTWAPPPPTNGCVVAAVWDGERYVVTPAASSPSGGGPPPGAAPAPSSPR